MGCSMTLSTKCNQVPEIVISTMGSILLVMNLQVKHGTTVLALPAIPLQDLVADQLVLVLVMRGHGLVLYGLTAIPEAYAAFSGSASTFTPARKSAQIISRQ